MLDPSTHATFVPGEPGRQARLALWPADTVTGRAAESEVGAVSLVVSSRDRVRPARMTAHLVPIGVVLDDLVQLAPDAPVSRSVAAWGHVARVAIDLAARGRLQPAIVSGHDTWVLTPLTEHDRQVRAALAAWMPPEAHCLEIVELRAADRPGDGGDRGQPGREPSMQSPAVAVAGFYNAVADSLPRTAAAGIASGLRAWAGGDLADVAALARFLPSADAGERTIVGLRVAMPAEPDDPFGIDLQLRSAIDPSLVIDAAALWAGETPEGFGPDAETDLLLGLRRGARLWPPLERLLAEPCPTRLELDDHEAIDLFGPLATDLVGAGVEVLVPAALTRTLEARAHVEPPPGAGDGPAHFDLATACELSWRGVLGGEPLDEHELSLLAQSRRPLVRLRGEWVVVDPRVVAKLGRRDTLSGADALVAALSGTAEVDGEVVAVEVGGATADLAARLDAASSPHELAEPDGLVATLRPYQRRGLAWMNEMVDLGLGGVLADDMGLGKTIQLIALHLHRMARAGSGDGTVVQQPTLVVCPATLVGNWQQELRRFAPDLQVHRYHGVDRDLAGIGPTDVVITTYGIARRDHPTLAEQPWGLVVADEAQQIKNPNASVSKAMRQLPAGARLALTGTPVENRLTELWSLLDWTTPGLLGGVEAFRRNVAIPVERDRDPEVTARFARIVSPFLLRRRKDDPEVAPDLPPKTETDHPVVLIEEQAGLYRAVVEEILDDIDKAEGIARRGLVLKLLTALKQVCNHPAHYLEPARAARRPIGQARGVRRSGASHRRRRRLDPRVHPVRRHGQPAHDPVGRARAAGRVPPRIADADPPHRDGRAVPGRRVRRVRHLAEGGRHRPQPDPGHPRHPLRPLVEPGRREPGVRSGVAHRAGPARAGAPADLGGHARGAHRHRARRQGRAGRGGRRHRRGVAHRARPRRARRPGHPRPGGRLMAAKHDVRPHVVGPGLGRRARGQRRARHRPPVAGPHLRPQGVGRADHRRAPATRRHRCRAATATSTAPTWASRRWPTSEWEQVAIAIGTRAAHVAALLDGELDPGIVADAESADIKLLPGAGDLRWDCSCPDWAEPCKHAAALVYLVANELDRDPFVLFLLRGIAPRRPHGARPGQPGRPGRRHPDHCRAGGAGRGGLEPPARRVTACPRCPSIVADLPVPRHPGRRTPLDAADLPSRRRASTPTSSIGSPTTRSTGPGPCSPTACRPGLHAVVEVRPGPPGRHQPRSRRHQPAVPTGRRRPRARLDGWAKAWLVGGDTAVASSPTRPRPGRPTRPDSRPDARRWSRPATPARRSG